MEQVEPNFLKEQIFDDLLQYQDLEVSHLTTTAELLPNQVLSRVLSSYKEFVDKTRQGDHGKTAQFYMTYIQLLISQTTLDEVPVTFDSLSKNFLSMILRFKSNRVDIVFDQYFTPSIKDFERTRRDELTRPVTIGPNQIRPHNFIAELKNINFKEAPVHFLLTIGLCYSYRVESNKVIKTLEDSLSCEEHEEADSRIIYHICQINVDAEVMIRCSDTDILIILLGNMDHFNASLTLWFICHIYGARDSWNVNEVRFQMFANTYRSKKSEDNLKKKIVTLTHPAYRHHLLRVRYVTKFWTNAYLKHPTSLSPQASGWTMNNNKYDFIWFDGEQLPSLVADIIIKDNNLLENDNNTKDDDDNESDSSDEDDYQDSPVL
ncbi:hypothetical protein SFRURICE_008886 [Spodoptera frugiperda]|nr:hypothetical protein SFRURICE_008886 [Spodoptera frugiperda]